MKMKTSLLPVLAGLSILISASASAKKLSTPEDYALASIDDMAGDTWAEGGDVSSIAFTSLTCDLKAEKCELGYKLKLYRKPLITSRCEIKDIAGYNDLIEVVKYGIELKDGISDQIDTCLNPLIGS